MRAAIILAALPLAACGVANSSASGDKVSASGAGESRSFAASGFTRVEAAGPDDVAVIVGPAFSVRAEGPGEALDTLEVRRDGDTLRIGRARGSWQWNAGDQRGLKVQVTLPRISGASIAGSGDMQVDRVSGDAFDGAVAGSGTLTLGALAVRRAKLSIAGSGDLNASGSADALDASIAGSGSIAANGLKARKADVSIAGSGDVAADVDGPASVSIVGSGGAELGPRARCTVSKMGSGEARCGG